MTNNFQPFSPLSEPIPLSPQSNLSRQSSNTQGLFIPNSSHSFSNTNFQNVNTTTHQEDLEKYENIIGIWLFYQHFNENFRQVLGKSRNQSGQQESILNPPTFKKLIQWFSNPQDANEQTCPELKFHFNLLFQNLGEIPDLKEIFNKYSIATGDFNVNVNSLLKILDAQIGQRNGRNNGHFSGFGPGQFGPGQTGSGQNLPNPTYHHVASSLLSPLNFQNTQNNPITPSSYSRVTSVNGTEADSMEVDGSSFIINETDNLSNQGGMCSGTPSTITLNANCSSRGSLVNYNCLSPIGVNVEGGGYSWWAVKGEGHRRY